MPFENAVAVIHHMEDIKQCIEGIGYSQVGKNALIKAVEADLNDPVIFGGLYALAVLEIQITSLLRMIDSRLHIIDTSVLYTELRDKIKLWSDDPSDLLGGKAGPSFIQR